MGKRYFTDKEAGALIKAIIAWKNGTENAAEQFAAEPKQSDPGPWTAWHLGI